MRVEGRRQAGVDPAALWAVVSDPERLGEALPGVESVDVESAERFTAFVRPYTGVGITPMHLAFTVRDRREGEHVRIEGRGRTGENHVEVGVEFDFAADGPGTAVRWSSDFRVLGVLGAVAQRTLPGLVAEQVDAVLAEAERQAGGRPDGGSAVGLVQGARPAPGPGLAALPSPDEVERAVGSGPTTRESSGDVDAVGAPEGGSRQLERDEGTGSERQEDVAGRGADEGDVADPDRYKGGGGR